jgi:beta-N-acetylhexosaminidase
MWDRDVAGDAAREATRLGQTLATELAKHGIDFSFTPVLDVDHGPSTVIGDRAFQPQPERDRAPCGSRCVAGFVPAAWRRSASIFRGMDFVAADSHTEMPVDPRPLADIAASDLVPFAAVDQMRARSHHARACGLSGGRRRAGRLLAQVAAGHPARASRLRRPHFPPTISGWRLAEGAGDIVARADASVAAGCDMVLACNDFAAIDTLIAHWKPPPEP